MTIYLSETPKTPFEKNSGLSWMELMGYYEKEIIFY